MLRSQGKKEIVLAEKSFKEFLDAAVQLVTELPIPTIECPLLASSIAVSYPIPEVAPVIMMVIFSNFTLPSKIIIMNHIIPLMK